MKQQIDIMVPMADGISLACDIRYPNGDGPWPAILLRTPYNKNIPYNPNSKNVYLDDGYVYVTQDVRGKHESRGEFQYLHEAQDGYDTIEWISNQPWCNGRVGMIGGSYSGYAQLAAAKLKPPSLFGITPAVFTGNIFKGVDYKNGVPQMQCLGWFIINYGRVCQAPTCDWQEAYEAVPLNTMDSVIGYNIPAFQENLKHPTYDDYWKAKSIEPCYDQLHAPTFLSGGWYDIFSIGLIRMYDDLFKSRTGNDSRSLKLLIGPWGHGLGTRKLGQLDFGPQAELDLENLNKRWLDCFVKEADDAIAKEPPVRIFVMGINEWRDEHEWPLSRAKDTYFYLNCSRSANSLFGDGELSTEISDGKDFDTYLYNPENPVPSIGNNTTSSSPCDHRPVERRDDVLVYTTTELTEELEVTGYIRLELCVSSTAVDTDFIGRLCNVFQDGRSINLCDGIFRMRFREGLDREVMMTPGETCQIEIDMEATSNVFLPGHRIRLEITSSSFPRFAPNHNTGNPVATDCEFKTATQTIYHSTQHPSRLILPVIPSNDCE
ncbi:MAG TPA: CocE/NonD family hydrolase [Phycisphaerae bacterium]|nr:CocE/NonD family hydrolase [Phycisphaerae bacterium]